VKTIEEVSDFTCAILSKKNLSAYEAKLQIHSHLLSVRFGGLGEVWRRQRFMARN
jgi:hypothetical protein